MEWKDLSIYDKADLMKIYVANGITNLSDIISHYNNYQEGGKLTFEQWKLRMQQLYPDIKMNNDEAGYDYNKYFENNYEDAISKLTRLSHFPDTYKLPNHPTFSKESIYSNYPTGKIGGTWEYSKPWETQYGGIEVFTPSFTNKEYYPNIYEEDRSYTEDEIYNKFQQGGTLGYVTPYGQWQYPHEVTTIPSNDITMKGVNYPVLGVSNTGDKKLMMPNSEYHFNGDYVTEYPLNSYQSGGPTTAANRYGIKMVNLSNVPNVALPYKEEPKRVVDNSYIVNDNVVQDKTYNTANRDVQYNVAVDAAERQRAINQQARQQGVLYEDTDTRSYAQRDLEDKIQALVDNTIYQQASPGNIDFNTLETGFTEGFKWGMVPPFLKFIRTKPFSFLAGLAGKELSDLSVRATSDYNTLGEFAANKIFGTEDKTTADVIDMFNPFMFAGGLYGNGVDKRLAELLVRRGDQLMSKAPEVSWFKHALPEAADYSKEALGQKHPVARYLFNPRDKNNVYNLGDKYWYSGSFDAWPREGDIVDIFFNKGKNSTGFQYTRETPTFFADYMQKNYPNKKPYFFLLGEAQTGQHNNISPYRTTVTTATDIIPFGKKKSFIDPGGFIKLEETPEVSHFADIWKYNGRDLWNRYKSGNRYAFPNVKEGFLKSAVTGFGDFIDANSTPIITQWYDTRPLQTNLQSNY